MGFLVGNDFIPHLPGMHINSGALTVLYKAYVEILPTLDGNKMKDFYFIWSLFKLPPQQSEDQFDL